MRQPNNISFIKLSLNMGISQAILYCRRKQAKDKGQVMPGNGKNAEQWFAAVLETAALNETELALYCRKKGLFVEQIPAWKKCFLGC
jgi:transposase